MKRAGMLLLGIGAAGFIFGIVSFFYAAYHQNQLWLSDYMRQQDASHGIGGLSLRIGAGAIAVGLFLILRAVRSAREKS